MDFESGMLAGFFITAIIAIILVSAMLPNGTHSFFLAPANGGYVVEASTDGVNLDITKPMPLPEAQHMVDQLNAEVHGEFKLK